MSDTDLWLDVQCDQVHPSCSRCSRLKIDCTGAGIRRFVFVDEAVPRDEARRLAQNRRKLGRLSTQVIQQIPPNALDSLTALMASKLSVKDPRYDVGWAYGPFLAGVPQRLGHSIALDAATEAFVLSLPPISNHRRQPDSSALESYIVALEATRNALADPVQCKNIDTLCAAYFLLVCQVSIIFPDGLQACRRRSNIFRIVSVFRAISGYMSLASITCLMISGLRLIQVTPST